MADPIVIEHMGRFKLLLNDSHAFWDNDPHENIEEWYFKPEMIVKMISQEAFTYTGWGIYHHPTTDEICAYLSFASLEEMTAWRLVYY